MKPLSTRPRRPLFAAAFRALAGKARFWAALGWLAARALAQDGRQTELLEFNGPGDFGNHFSVNGASGVYAEAEGIGLGGTRAVAVTSGSEASAVYTARAVDFSQAGAEVTLSMFAKRNTNNGRFLGLALINDPTAQVTTSSGSYFINVRLEAEGLQIQNRAAVFHSATDQPFLTGPLALAPGHWYKLTATFKHADTNTVAVSAALDDYGLDGLAFAASVATVPPTNFVNALITADTETYALFRGRSTGGAEAYDNFQVEVSAGGVPPPQPAELGLRLVPGLTLQGEVGRHYEIQYQDGSVQPGAWKTLATMLLTNSPIFYLDLTATNPGARFYQAKGL
jgi:hypothetical protein